MDISCYLACSRRIKAFLFSMVIFICGEVYMLKVVQYYRCRPYYSKCTRSHPNSEVKRDKAGLVLRWGTAWETPVLTAFFVFNLISRLCTINFIFYKFVAFLVIIIQTNINGEKVLRTLEMNK